MEDYRSLCPINLALEVIGDKWSLIIIRDIAFEGKRHFRELLQSEEKMASNVLTDRLNMLEREGILTKRPDPAHKQKYIYSLTEKGLDLIPVIIEMGTWSFKYQPVDKERHKHAAMLIEGGKKAQTALIQELRKGHLSV